MLLPLSDAPNPRGTPVVTYLLITVNVLVYLFVTVPLNSHPADLNDPALPAYLDAVRDAVPPGTSLRAVFERLTTYDLFVFEHGFKPGAPQLRDLFVSLFLHGGLMHLFGNMLFLWIYGDNVEHRLGRVAFLFWYLATGIAATLVFAAFAGDSRVPLVGASGAISGVLGFYYLWFPRNTVRVFVFLFPFFMNVIAIPARIVLAVYLLIDNLLPLLMAGGGTGGVAHGAHLGGFVAGLAAAWMLTRRDERTTPAPFVEPPDVSPAPADTVAGAMAAGQIAHAARLYVTMPTHEARGQLTRDESLRLAEWLAGGGHDQAALLAFRRHLAEFPTGATAARAHLGIGLIQLERLGQVAPAYHHLLEALELDPDPDTTVAARNALAHIATLQKYQLGRRP